jgi:hypothetical protein
MYYGEYLLLPEHGYKLANGVDIYYENIANWVLST